MNRVFACFVIAAPITLALVGCPDAAEGTPPTGDRNGRCYANGTCDEGLECRDGVCVPIEGGPEDPTSDAGPGESDADVCAPDACECQAGESCVDCQCVPDQPAQCPGPLFERDMGWNQTGTLTVATAGQATFLQRGFEQADGKIIAVGGVGQDSLLVRIGSGGALDTGFGTGGRIERDVGAGSVDFFLSVAEQPGASGSFLVLGQALMANVLPFVARYSSEGAADGAFGTSGGLAIPSAVTANTFSRGLAVAADGSFAVLAYQQTGSPGFRTVILRYDATGAPMASFGGSGMIVTTLPGVAEALPRAIDFGSDGSLVVAASDEGPGTDHDMLFAKVDATTGAFVGTFGTNGVIKRDFAGGFDLPTVLSAKAPNRVYAAGLTLAPTVNGGAALTCFELADGAPCAGFGTDGKMVATGMSFTNITGLVPVRVGDDASGPPNQLIVSGFRSPSGPPSDAVAFAITDLTQASPSLGLTNTLTLDFAQTDLATSLLPRRSDGALVLFATSSDGSLDQASVAEMSFCDWGSAFHFYY